MRPLSLLVPFVPALLALAALPLGAKEVSIAPSWTVEIHDEAGRPVAGLKVEEDWEFLGLNHPQSGAASQLTDAHGRATFPPQSFTEPELGLAEGRTLSALNVHGSYGATGSVYVRSPGHKVGGASFDKANLFDQPGSQTTRPDRALLTVVTLIPLDVFDFLARRDWPTARRMVSAQPALVGARDPQGATPLITLAGVADLNADSELLGELLGAGADVNAQARDGRTALHNAAMNHNVPLIEFLLTKGANPNLRIHDSATYIENGYTPLHFLFFANGNRLAEPPVDDKIAALDAFVAHGADMNARDATGETPLRLAQEWGDPELVRALLDRGAKPERR